MPSRRAVLAGIAAAAATGCKRADWCDEPQLRDDGPFPYPDLCPVTASDIEGPYYLPDAPERANLDQHGDEGTPLSLSGQVFEADCDTPLAGAVLEFWQADPDGRYDNDSSEQRYRCQLTCDGEGRYSLQTLLPGRYLNGAHYRPRHIHVKVTDPDGIERLTTQLYFEGDPHLSCDAFASTSLVLPFSGSEETEMAAEDVHFVLA